MIEDGIIGRLLVLTAAGLLAACSAPDDEAQNGESAQTAAQAEFAYIPLQGASQIAVVDLASSEIVGRVQTDGRSIDTRITPDYGKIYVINVFSPNVSVVRGRCPQDEADWMEVEREAGACVPNSHLGTITVDDQSAGHFAISEDGATLFLVSSSGLNIIDTKTDRIIRKITPEGAGEFRAVEVDPDGRTVWIGSREGLIQAVDIESGALLGRQVQVAPEPSGYKISRDGKWLYTGNFPVDPARPGMYGLDDLEGVIQAVNLETMEVVATQPVGLGTFIIGLEISSDDSQIWTANGNNTISLMDGATHELVQTITTGFDTTEAVELTPDGRLLLAVGHMGKLDPAAPTAEAQAFAQFYSTETFEKVGDPIDLGNTSGGIPSISPL